MIFHDGPEGEKLEMGLDNFGLRMGSLPSRLSPLIANKKEKTQTSKQTEAEERGERKGERVGKKKGKSQDQLSYSSSSYPHFI